MWLVFDDIAPVLDSIGPSEFVICSWGFYYLHIGISKVKGNYNR